MRQRPIQGGPVGAGLAAGNDRDWAAGVMERWSVDRLHSAAAEAIRRTEIHRGLKIESPRTSIFLTVFRPLDDSDFAPINSYNNRLTRLTLFPHYRG